VAEVKHLWFPERTIAAVLRVAAELGMSPDELRELQVVLRDHFVDVKAADARLLLKRLAADPGGDAERDWVFNQPMAYQALVQRDQWVVRDEGTTRLEHIAQHHALFRADGQQVTQDALHRAAALALAQLLEFEPDQRAVREEFRRLCRRLKLAAADIPTWLRRNDLSSADLLRLLREEATLRHLRGWVRHRQWLAGAVGPTLDHLRLRGEYEQWSCLAAAQDRQTQAAGSPGPEEPPTVEQVIGRLREHARNTGIRFDAPVAQWAREMGFTSVQDLIRLLPQLESPV
jgi:hypothetical protein